VSIFALGALRWMESRLYAKQYPRLQSCEENQCAEFSLAGIFPVGSGIFLSVQEMDDRYTRALAVRTTNCIFVGRSTQPIVVYKCVSYARRTCYCEVCC